MVLNSLVRLTPHPDRDEVVFECVVKDKIATLSLQEWKQFSFSVRGGLHTLHFPKNFFVDAPGGCFALEINLPCDGRDSPEILQVIDVNIRKCHDMDWWEQVWKDFGVEPPTRHPAIHEVTAVAVGIPLKK